jgi:hypothetical protein
MRVDVWRNESDGKLYHDICFEDGESREGYGPVKRDELEDDSTCESCGGNFLIGITTSGMTDDDNEDDEDDDEVEAP